jgi:HK97 gp10 family phage protein
MSNKITKQGREKIARELEKKAIKVVREAKKEAPVDTGRLRASITYEIIDLPGQLPKALVGSNVEYAPDQEFGTEEMPANPFLRPALNRLKLGQL